MWIQIVILVLGLAVLTGGAEALVRGGASLARRLGLTPLLVGLTVVSFGTSAPELVVSLGSAVKGAGDIAVGNVVGSNIFNIGVILGLAAIVCPIQIKLSLIKLDTPLMILVSLMAVILVLMGGVPRWAGIALFLMLVSYTVFSVRMARKEAAADVDREFEEGVPQSTGALWLDVVLIVGGLVLLILGAEFFLRSATSIARSFGISEAVIGLTIVAAGTSMPELATSLIAAVRGQSDISVGNIIGSNIFNILGILGVAATVNPLVAPGISRVDVFVMLAYAVALMPLIWTGRKLQRWEGVLLVTGYLVYLWQLWPKN